MRRSCCSQGKKQITLLSSVYLRPHFPLRSQQLIAYCEWQHFVFLNTGSKTITTTVLYKDENFLWSGFYCNRSHHGNVTTPLRFLFILCFSVPGVFLRNRLREFVPAIIASIISKFKQILWERFRNNLKRSFKHNKNSEIECYQHN